MAVIGYIGNYTYSHCTEVHIANTLEDMGHQVIRIQETPDLNTNNIRADDYDLLLWTRTPDLASINMPQILELCKINKLPTVSYHLDLYIGLYRESGLDSDPFWRTDYVFSPDGDPVSAEIFKKKGINHHWVKPGVYKKECYIVDNPKDKDVIFVGSKGYHAEWPYRPQLISWLQNTYGDRFEHWGSDGKGVIRNDALNQLYGATKVVVGDSLCLNGHQNYWSDRPYETIGRGGFLIMPDIPGLRDDIPGLVTYELGNFHQLETIINYYLSEEGPPNGRMALRERTRRSLHKYVKENCTYNHRLKEMLRIIK